MTRLVFSRRPGRKEISLRSQRIFCAVGLALLVLALSPASRVHADAWVACGDSAGLASAVWNSRLTGGTVHLAPCTYYVPNGGFNAVWWTATVDGHGATLQRPWWVPQARFFSVPPGGNLTLRNMTLRDGWVNGEGGAIFLGSQEDRNAWWYASFSAYNVAFVNNYATLRGGAISNHLPYWFERHENGVAGSITLDSGVYFDSNSAGEEGGAVWLNHPWRDVHIHRVEGWNNRAGITGGFLTVDMFGPVPSPAVYITRSTFRDNYTNRDGNSAGGAMFFNRHYAYLTNNTFYNNRTTGRGGAIFNSLAALYLTHNTFASNGAGWGGALWGAITAPNLRNNIFANSWAGGNCYNQNGVSDLGGNVQWPPWDASCAGSVGDPRLSAPGWNGGYAETLALGTRSAAVDVVNCWAANVWNDERDYGRPDGPACDAGAYEGTSRLASSTYLSSSLNPSYYGQTVTFYAQVVGADGATPTGTVTFYLDGSPAASVGLSGGWASWSVNWLAAGSHTLSAAYGGERWYFPSSSTSRSQAVYATTTTALSSNRTPSTYGTAVTFSATVVASNGAYPGGTVSFYVDGGWAANVAVSGGRADWSTGSLSVGVHSIRAVYGGSGYYDASASSVLTQGVNGPTSTSLASSINPSVVGQGVTFSAHIVPADGSTVGGSVTFALDGAPVASVSLSGGWATWSTSALSVGTHTVRATYNGSGYYTGSTSPDSGQAVNKANTTTAITSHQPNPSTVGQSVPIFFAVAVNPPGSAPLSGVVTITDGTASCTATVPATSCSLTFTAGGSRTITAAYAGNASLNGSSDSAVHTVSAPTLSCGGAPFLSRLLWQGPRVGQPAQILTGAMGGVSFPQPVQIRVTRPDGQVVTYNTLAHQASFLFGYTTSPPGEPYFGTSQAGSWQARLSFPSYPSLVCDFNWQVVWFIVHTTR